MSEVNSEEYMRGFEDGRREGWRQKVDVAISAPKCLRVEALCAAVELAKAVNHDRRECVERTLNTADQFARWLETGER